MAFLGMILKVKLTAKFWLHSFFLIILSPNKLGCIFSISFPLYCFRGLIVVIVYFFQIWNKKEHNIIRSRVISSHTRLMYIETPYIISSRVINGHMRPMYIETPYIISCRVINSHMRPMYIETPYFIISRVMVTFLNFTNNHFW